VTAEICYLGRVSVSRSEMRHPCFIQRRPSTDSSYKWRVIALFVELPHP
jgi:hypothetical protein